MAAGRGCEVITMKVLTADRDGKVGKLIAEILELCRGMSGQEACHSETSLLIHIADEAPAGHSTPKLLVRQNRGYRVVKVEDILFAEAGRPRSIIHLADEELAVDMSLGKLEETLGSGFIRTHNSYLVNVERIAGISSSGDRSYQITFDHSDKVAWTSRSRAGDLIDKVELMCHLSRQS